MARVKRGVTAHKRHKRLLQDAEGRRGTRSRLVKPAREALLHALAYATRDRKQRKRQMRQLWIVRINAASRQNGMTYGQFIAGLKKADVVLNLARIKGRHVGPSPALLAQRGAKTSVSIPIVFLFVAVMALVGVVVYRVALVLRH